MNFLKKQFVYTKVALKVDLEIKAVSSMKLAIPEDIVVQWLRGPFTAETKPYSFVETVLYKGEVSKRPKKKIELSDKFQKISSFYKYPKTTQWQPKNCIFKILSLNKE